MSLAPFISKIDPDKKNIVHISTVSSTHVVATPKPPVIEQIEIERPTSRKIPVRGAYSTPSILEALKDDPKSENTGKVAEKGSNQYVKKEINKSFSQAELLEVWKSFVSTVDAPQLKSALSAREPLLTKPWQIGYELDTELQLNRLTIDLKPKLLGFLRRELDNESIEITFSVSEILSPHSGIPYTDEEKWNLLVERYPALGPLKSKFGLDFEHY